MAAATPSTIEQLVDELLDLIQPLRVQAIVDRRAAEQCADMPRREEVLHLSRGRQSAFELVERMLRDLMAREYEED